MATKKPAHGKAPEKTGAWEHATAGTYVDVCTSRPLVLAVIVIGLVMMLAPSLGMLVARTDSTTENRELSAAPALFAEDGSFNWNVLADTGAYFDDHFALRNQLVAANAHLRATLGTSATDQVVVGTDDWLYYGGTLPDYLGQSALSDRTLRNIAHNLSLAQRYAESKGASFLFTIAPNKNSLYDGHMPYYYVKTPEPGNAERLKPLLEEAKVNYFDLFELFEGKDETYYLQRDTHWNNRGALLATQALFDTLGKDRLAVGEQDAIARDDFTGDLESMLYPSDPRTETQWYFEGYDDEDGAGSLWSYVEGSDVTDNTVSTSSPGGTGSLLMFRDSFANALIPLWAPSFQSASFSKLIPYNLGSLARTPADTVVVERAERHIDYLAKNPPIMPNPTVKLRESLSSEQEFGNGGTSLELTTNGPYWVISGEVDQSTAEACGITDRSRFLVSIEKPDGETVVYDAFWKSVEDGEKIVNDYGYQAFMMREGLDFNEVIVRVHVITDGKPTCLCAYRDLSTNE